MKDKKVKAKELKEIEAAASGGLKSNNKDTPEHVTEGANAVAFVAHTIKQSQEFEEEHKVKIDELKQGKLDEEKEAK
jgi:hypothetical protein